METKNPLDHEVQKTIKWLNGPVLLSHVHCLNPSPKVHHPENRAERGQDVSVESALLFAMYNSPCLLLHLNNGCQISGLRSSFCPGHMAWPVICGCGGLSALGDWMCVPVWGSGWVCGSVKGSRQSAWILCSGCCLLPDFPILPWRWIKHDAVGEVPRGQGARWHGEATSRMINLGLLRKL